MVAEELNKLKNEFILSRSPEKDNESVKNEEYDMMPLEQILANQAAQTTTIRIDKLDSIQETVSSYEDPNSMSDKIMLDSNDAELQALIEKSSFAYSKIETLLGERNNSQLILERLKTLLEAK